MLRRKRGCSAALVEAAAKRTPAPSGAAGVGGQALRSTQRRCGAVKVESEADLDGPQVTPEGGAAPLSEMK